MKRKWYGVFALNGLGVYTDYAKFVNDSYYMRGERIKAFREREDAEDFAISGFDDLCGVECRARILLNLEHLYPNYFYFRRKSNEN